MFFCLNKFLQHYLFPHRWGYRARINRAFIPEIFLSTDSRLSVPEKGKTPCQLALGQSMRKMRVTLNVNIEKPLGTALC